MNYIICYLFHGKVKSLNKGKNGNHLAATIKHFPRGMLRRVQRKSPSENNKCYLCYRTTFSKNNHFGWRTAEDCEYVIFTKLTRLNNTKKTILQDCLQQKRHEMASTVPLRLVIAAFIEITRFYSRYRAFSGFSCRSNKLHSKITNACFKGFFDENMQDSNNVLC